MLQSSHLINNIKDNFLSKVRRLVTRILSMEKFPTLLTFKSIEEKKVLVQTEKPS